jgi:hypothetical protein
MNREICQEIDLGPPREFLWIYIHLKMLANNQRTSWHKACSLRVGWVNRNNERIPRGLSKIPCGELQGALIPK